MFDARPSVFWSHFRLLATIITASLAGTAAAQSAATAGSDWRPAGIVRPTTPQPVAPANANQVWRLPNGQSSSRRAADARRG